MGGVKFQAVGSCQWGILCHSYVLETSGENENTILEYEITYLSSVFCKYIQLCILFYYFLWDYFNGNVLVTNYMSLYKLFSWIIVMN